jgi:hypothetical protein
LQQKAYRLSMDSGSRVEIYNEQSRLSCVFTAATMYCSMSLVW